MLKGVVALVTGGASGLGKGCVDTLVKQGGRVVICDLPNSKGADVANQIGDQAVFVPVDVRSEEDVKKALNAAKSKYGRLDVAVNCAGIIAAQRVYNFKKNIPFDLTTFQNVINVNLVGTFNVSRLAAGLIGENEPNADGHRGVIINTASIAAFDGQVGQAAYSASKGGVVSLTLCMARDFATQGIRVVTIAPGIFKTPMFDKLSEKQIAELTANVPFPKRLGNPEEFGKMVESVINNPLLNGETIRLDGALRMQ